MNRKRTRVRNGREKVNSGADVSALQNDERIGSDGFALSFSNGRGILALDNIALGETVKVERLELIIQDLAFPFDVTGGVRGLKHRRHVLGRLKMTVTLDGLEDLAKNNLKGSEWCGIPTIVFEKNHIAILFEYGPKDGRIRVSFRLIPRQSDNGVELIVDEPRVYGPLPAVSLNVVTTALKEMSGMRPMGLSLAINNPVKAALVQILPSRGWRLPDYSDVTLAGLELLPDKAVLDFRSVDTLDGPLMSPSSSDSDDDLAMMRRFEEGRLTMDGDIALCEGQVEDARSIYSKILDRDPSSPIATAKLSMVDIANPDQREMSRLQAYDTLKNNPDRTDLAAVVAQGAALASDSSTEEEACRLLAKMGNSLERFAASSRRGELLLESEPELAAEAYLQALSARREDLDTLSRLLETYAAIGDKERAYALIPRRIAAQKHAAKRAQTYVEVGQILLHQMNDPAEAMKYFERATVGDPKDMDAAWGLAESCAGAGDLKRAIAQFEHLTRILKGTDDTQSMAKALAAIGNIWMDQGETEIAVHRLEEALDLAPGLHRERVNLARMLKTMSREAEAASEYETALSLTKSERGELWWVTSAMELADLYLNELSDPGAAEMWIRECLDHEEVASKAKASLIVALERQGNFDSLAEQLEKEQADQPKVEVSIRLAEIRLSKGNLKETLEFIEHSRNQFPDNEKLLDLLIDVCRKTNDIERLKSAIQEKIDTTPDPRVRGNLELEMGVLESRDLKDPIAAVPWFKRAMARESRAPEASQNLGMVMEEIQKLADKAVKDGDWEKAKGLFAAAGSEMKGIQRFALALKEAESAFGFEDWNEALKAAMIACDGPVAIKAPASKIAARALVELEAPDEAVRHLEQIAENLDPGEAASVLFFASELTHKNLENGEATADLLRRVLEIDPDHQEASKSLERVLEEVGDNLGLAERLIEAANKEGSSEKLRQAIDLLTKEGKTERAIELLESIFEQTGDVEDALQLARLLRENDLVDELLSLFEDLRAKNIEIDTQFLEELEILADIFESRTDYLSAYKVTCELARYPDETGVKAARAARVAETVGKLDEARDLLFQSINVKPEPSRIIKLISFLDPEKDTEDLEQLLDLARDSLDSFSDADKVLFLNAEVDLYFSADKEDEAVEKLEEMVELAPENKAIWNRLVSIHSRRGRWDKLAAQLEKRLAMLTSPEDIADESVYLGKLLEEKLGDELGAQVAFDRALEVVPHHQEALKSRASMAFERQKWERLSELIKKIEDDPNDATILLWKAAAYEHTSRAQEAQMLYQRVVGMDSSNQRAKEGLMRLEQSTDLEGRLTAAFDKLQREDD